MYLDFFCVCVCVRLIFNMENKKMRFYHFMMHEIKKENKFWNKNNNNNNKNQNLYLDGVLTAKTAKK